MDLSKIPEKDRQRLLELLERKQVPLMQHFHSLSITTVSVYRLSNSLACSRTSSQCASMTVCPTSLAKCCLERKYDVILLFFLTCVMVAICRKSACQIARQSTCDWLIEWASKWPISKWTPPPKWPPCNSNSRTAESIKSKTQFLYTPFIICTTLECSI